MITAFLVLNLLTNFAVAQGPGDAIAVVVRKDNPASNLSFDSLARIYRGQQTSWKNGEEVLVVNQSARSAIRKSFYERALKDGGDRKYYQPGSPVPFSTMVQDSSAAVKMYVSRVPGAIGYIWLHEVDDSVKVVAIENQLPTPENLRNGIYPLGVYK